MKQSQENPSLEKGGEGGFSDKKLSATPFDDLKRELLSRKYSYKIVNPVRKLSQMGYAC